MTFLSFRFFIFLLVWFSPTVSFAADVSLPANSLTLQQCYDLALKQSEDLAIKAQAMEQASGRFIQSLSGVLPEASFSYSHRRQEATASTAKDVPEAKFVFSQPLFSGFREFAAIAGSRSEGRQRQQEELRARQWLFVDVADAFYFLLSYQEELKALSEIRQALFDRVEELVKRQQLGRSRLSEVASVKVRLSRMDADIESLKADAQAARQLLEFLTGTTVPSLEDSTPSDDVCLDEDVLLEQVTRRADVVALREAWNVSRNKVTVARADFFPTAILEGNYYTKRVGASEDVDWDMTFRVDVPIFSGGETAGQVKTARSESRVAELMYREALRRAQRDVQDALSDYTHAMNRYRALEQANQFALESHQLHRDDYQKSMVSNLDVMQSIEDLKNAQRDFLSSGFLVKRTLWKLRLASGDWIP